MRLSCIVLVLLHVALAFSKKFVPFSDEYIEHINNQKLTWTARKHFAEGTSIRHLLGALPDKLRSTLPVITYADDTTEIPESFDAREKWPDCKSLNEIRDQANCGSCWAFAAVEAMTDRICIHSNGKITTSVSAEDLLSCCGDLCGDGCEGGWPAAAWQYWYETGIVSGGLYQATDGCRSYSLPPCEHHVAGNLVNCADSEELGTPKCTKECDAGKNLNYTLEITRGQKPYAISSVIKDIQLEIMTNGPVEASYDVYDDFPLYSEGVYERSEDSEFEGGHAVKIIGWGVEKVNNADVPYWLIANSWNADWGDKGYFKMIRGKNNCGIESNIVAGFPEHTSSAVVPKLQTIAVLLSIFLFYINH